MATLVLQAAGSAVGSFLGGPFGAALGSAVGGMAGSMVDRALMGGSQKRVIEGPRLKDIDGISAREGASVPRIYGRVRVGGQVIWATEFEEERVVEKSGSSGGKSIGGGGSSSAQTTTITYKYFANVALGLCEGPIAFVRRIWVDGQPLDLGNVTYRFYPGSDDQPQDPLIVAKQGTSAVPAFHGLAYIVFERLPLADYGNRLPQFSFEVVRPSYGLPAMIRAINLIPGSTEFGYEPGEVREEFGYGNSRTENRAQWMYGSDWEASMEALNALLPNLEQATLINAWFGDDVRVGACTLRPKVERNAKVTSGGEWQVAGLARGSALPVSWENDRANYGGSPSDASVIHAIRDLKARGLKVTLHPFILMDIPTGNGLPDPYTGANGQSLHPWRGRITCDPAPGRPGTPENSAAVTTQIAAFFGTAAAAHFSLSGESVVYSGPEEWSFRRMVLHQAMLAVAAGGVDTFYLGSELVGLTRLSAGNGVYPAVQALIALLAEVRALLGATTRLTYAADWTEYGSHVRNGGAEIRFPLDPFWAHPQVNAVAIDFYPPISDWRAGGDHLDADIAYSSADPAYLEAGLAAGEAFDWYYADLAGRGAQTRLPITDGAYNKPWIYRPKDLVNWWSNPHVERVGGSELGAPTAFIPKSKPILLAEIGCPAVDKGANQPNVFPDPKSAENGLPHFSSGNRDDLVQWRVLEAYFSRFDPALPGHVSANNPISPLYGAAMVDVASIAPWAFDVRPFPSFPTLTSLWSDGVNWARGHWINGRIEGMPIDQLIAMIMDDFGLAAPSFALLDGFVEGYVIERPMSSRAALEPIAGLFGIAARLDGDTVHFMGPPKAQMMHLTREDIVPERDGKEIEITRRQESELPREISLSFIDGDKDFRRGVVSSRRLATLSRREASEEAALVLQRAEALKLVEARLQEVWSGRERFRFSLRRNCLLPEPGDVVALDTHAGPRLLRLTRVSDGAYRQIEGVAFDPSLNDDVPVLLPTAVSHELPAMPGAPHVEVIELPLTHSSSAGLLFVAVRASPWRGPYTISHSQPSGVISALATVPAAARIGETLTAFPPGPLWRWDHAASLEILLEGGAIASMAQEPVLAGANALALIAPSGEIEVVLAQNAILIGDRRYRLSGFVRGIGVSESAASRLLAIGARVVVIDNALAELPASIAEIGREVTLLVTPAGRAAGDNSVVYKTVTAKGRALRPLAPVFPKARREGGSIRLSFIRRARFGGDNFDLYEVPLAEDREEYQLRIMAGSVLKRAVTLNIPVYLYASADELADFGSAQASLTIEIAQISGQVGPGDVLQASVPVF